MRLSKPLLTLALSQFVLITWIGPEVRVMRKAKLSVHAADVKRVLSAYSIDVPASSVEDLAEVRGQLRAYCLLQLWCGVC